MINKHRFLSIFLLLSLSTINTVKAQFLNSVGITLGGTYANEHWKDETYKINASKGYKLGYNGSILLEFLEDDNFRWDSELQYNQKGTANAKSNQNVNLDYLAFNNYLKFRYELLTTIPYVLIGPRLEYPLSATTNNPEVQGSFAPIHLSLAIGAGIAFVSPNPIKFFVEAFYNPDISYAHKTDNFDILNHTFELRVGIKYNFAKKKRFKDIDCNSPTYIPDF